MRIVSPLAQDEGYCFRVPRDWEIREKLEGADVVCLAPPIKGKFRDSIVATSLSAAQMKDPLAALTGQLGQQVKVLERGENPSDPILVELNDPRVSPFTLRQLIFLHRESQGHGVAICCTTTADEMVSRREFFNDVVEQAKFELEHCVGPGGLPKVFPTPEVTYSPSP